MKAPIKKPTKHDFQGDLFICDVADVILKDDMATMEHPFYSLTKKPDTKTKRYESSGFWIEFRPSVSGLPTIYDKDLIIYVVSQLVAGCNQGREISKNVKVDPYAFLVFSKRSTGGRDYESLAGTIDRIDGMRFRTNVLYNGTRTDEWMGIIDKTKMETCEKTGRIKSLEITVSDWVMDSVINMNVLTLHPDYFRLSRPIDRRIYEIVRKSVGKKRSWSFLISTLHTKTGSKGSLREFRRQLRPLLEHDYLPGFSAKYDKDSDKIIFYNKNSTPVLQVEDSDRKQKILHRITSDGYEKARKIVVGWDVYQVSNFFAEWWAKLDKPIPKNADALFIKFCKTWYEKNGNG